MTVFTVNHIILKIQPMMELIFHEKQEGSLCAQHCLNALLQGSYFTAVDLAEIARELDERERLTMAEGGLQSFEYQQFLEQPSSNFDDSGFFSIQVLQKALKIWNLELINYTSQDARAVAAKADPNSQKAFICNYREHWLSIRKLGHQWFNLNSLLTEPELLSDTYLTLFLTQLQKEGYSLFIVLGELPVCEADQVLQLQRVTQAKKPQLISEELTMKKLGEEQASNPDQGLDYELQQALMESHRLMSEDEDSHLQQALSLSLQGNTSNSNSTQMSSGETSGGSLEPNQEEVRRKRLVFFDQQSSQAASTSTTNSQQSATGNTEHELSEEELLEAAIRMSMESAAS